MSEIDGVEGYITCLLCSNGRNHCNGSEPECECPCTRSPGIPNTDASHPTTAEHFAIFEKEVRYWVDRFGLRDWHVGVKHTSEESDGIKHVEQAGSISYNVAARYAVIALAKADFGEEPKDEVLRRVAFHEVVHLLLAEFSALGESRYVNREEFERAEHAIIRRLEGAIQSLDARLRVA